MSFNAKDMTQGGQIASMRIRMFSQIANIMLYCLFIFFWILVGLVLWVKISWQTFVNGCIYWWCTTLEGMRDLIKSQPVYEIQYYGKTFRMNAAQVLHDKYMIWCGEQLWSAFVLATVVALVICLITFFVVSWILGRQGKQQSENEVTGGRQLTDNPKDVARMLKKDDKDSDNYYTDKDNYYVLGSMGERWAGRGAEQLGLQGSVDKDVFTRLLEGRLPDGADLSRMQDGSNKHRPGYDLTFSAPKSVSMMAMLGG
ncbi:TPA: relaxase domain-containing protein, partial [Escherichia coli]|nr:relaxase domain-containing protein [Escherichia coli]